MRELQEAPLKNKDRDLMNRLLEGATYKELAQEFNLSESRINKWKRSVFECLFRYEQTKHSLPSRTHTCSGI